MERLICGESGEKGCEYFSKEACNVKKHEANIHDIDVVYYPCNVKCCKYKSKEADALKRLCWCTNCVNCCN